MDVNGSNEVVCADFARQLEREFAEADGTISHLRMENGLIEFYKCRDQIKELEGQLANMTAQRDALAKVARDIRAGYGGQVVDPDCICDDCEFLGKLDSALATLEGRGE
jgi:hypothetical protein